MKRITQKDLEYLVERINEATGSPLEPWTRTQKAVLASEGKKHQKAVLKANIGNYYLDYAYSGVKLVRMVNEGGGISVISTTGYGTKRELYYWMQAFLAGYTTKK